MVLSHLSCVPGSGIACNWGPGSTRRLVRGTGCVSNQWGKVFVPVLLAACPEMRLQTRQVLR